MILAKVLLGLTLVDGIIVALLLTDACWLVLVAFWLFAAAVMLVVVGPILLWAAVARRLNLGNPTRGPT